MSRIPNRSNKCDPSFNQLFTIRVYFFVSSAAWLVLSSAVVGASGGPS